GHSWNFLNPSYVPFLTYARISFTVTRVKFCRCPIVLLYCFFRLNLKTITLSPRPCAWIVPFTLALVRSGPATSSFESRNSATTRPNSISAPGSPFSVSTSIVSPGVTRYCFPPVSITACMVLDSRNFLDLEATRGGAQNLARCVNHKLLYYRKRALAAIRTTAGRRQPVELVMEIKRIGSQPSSKGPADWFTGSVRIDPLFQAPGPALVAGASVTFEPRVQRGIRILSDKP